MHPRIVTLPPLRMVGLRGRFTPATMEGIPALWGAFVPHLPSIRGWRGDVTYGVCFPCQPGPERPFEYVAAVEVEGASPPPEGLEALTVPGGAYAVWTHEGHISGIVGTFDAIFTKWLPASGLRHLPAPDLERYDERWDPSTGTGPVDIYIPVEPPPAR